MERELKHILPFLPDLKVIDAYGVIGNIEGIDLEQQQFLINSEWHDIGSFKPVYFPLSSLTKEIEMGGEQFIPNHHRLMKFWVNEEREMFLSDALSGSFYQVQKLLEWKFDVFGLIPAGLAIDVTGLEPNPYSQ